jgi:predicted Zn-dependent protease
MLAQIALECALMPPASAADALDLALLSRWIDPLGADGLADLFFEWRSEVAFDLRDGAVAVPEVVIESGVAARARRGGRVVLACSPRADEEGAREAIRRAAAMLPSSRHPKAAEALPPAEAEAAPEAEVFARKTAGLFARALDGRPHRARVERRLSSRLIVAAGRPPHRYERARLSFQGTVLADTRGGPRWRGFRFHVAEAEREPTDELRARLREAAEPGDRPVDPPSGLSDVLLSRGCATFFFHEALSHPLEADAALSRLFGLARARVAPREIHVADEPGRLDLFGGYPVDDEGVPAHRTPLLDAGHLAGLLRDRLHADSLHPPTGNGRRAGVWDAPAPRGANVVVAAGGASEEEMLHRLSDGILISAFEGGTVDPASGRFRLTFPSAHAVHRGRLAHVLGPGVLEGDIVEALGAVDPLLGSKVSPSRELAWCAREGKTVPVGGEAPSVIVRRLHARPR